MNQLSLFDQPARMSDPATSQLAATDICERRSELHEVAITAAKQLLKKQPDATANEIGRRGSEISSRPAETIRKRVHELVRLGMLVICGERKCSTSGKLARTFNLHTEGKDVSSHAKS